MLYFDHSATTPIHATVLERMQEVEAVHFGNPSSTHAFGRKTKALVETARRQMADAIHCDPEEVIFTGGGSEANNIVIWNLLHKDKKHVVTSSIEHPSVELTLSYLKSFGITMTKVPVDSHGRVDPDSVEKAIREDTGLITIMMANNEIGTLEPVAEIADIARSHHIPFHSDGVQVLGKLPVNVNTLRVDFMSFSAHKFYGPKGIGALYIKKGNKLGSLIIGGSQERQLRAGTENVAGIAGMGVAAEWVSRSVESTRSHLLDLETLLRNKLAEKCPGIRIHGHPDHHLPGLVNVEFPQLRSDQMLIYLDRQGMAVSSGSACGSGTVKPSHVLEAIGVDPELNLHSIRVSFGYDNTREDVEKLVDQMAKALQGVSGGV